MKNKKRKSSKSTNKNLNIAMKIISWILIITALVSTVFLIYFEVLPILYLILFIIFVGLIIVLFFKLLNNRKLKHWVRIVIAVPSTLLIILFTIICFYAYGTIDFFNNIFDVGVRHDTYSVYVLNDSSYKEIKDLNKKIIGVSEIKDESTEKAIEKVSKKIEFNMAEYDNTSDSVDALKDKEVDAIIALDSNIDLINEENEDYKTLKSIYTFTVTTKVETLTSSKDVTKENFVLYISGIDTNGKVSQKARSDVNMLLAVNPKSKKILMLNTPRDFYVKLSEKNAYDKLTHAGFYGIEESVNTLSDFYDVDIDFYARINFTTFINIVEKLGGIEVNVPLKFCEQTSSRTSTKKICLKKGLQTLNGEEALALSRTRYSVAGGDRGRIKNQMLVLNAIIDKAMSPKIITKYNSLLNSVDDSLITNVDQKSITKLIKKQIKDGTGWEIESYSVNGSDSYATTYSTGKAKAYVMKPDEKTILEAKKKLDAILETNKYAEEITTKAE